MNRAKNSCFAKPQWLFIAGLTAAGISLLSTVSFAQNAPSDLLDLSLEALLQVPVKSSSAAEAGETTRWQVSYSYQTSHFEGYHDGDASLSSDELLWNPSEGPRGDKYIAVTPEVTQEVHAFSVGYTVTDTHSIQLVLPYILQETRHRTIIPEWEAFNTRTDGFGDVVLAWDHTFARSIDSEWHLTLGVSAPLGSIDEKAETPRGYGQLPYNMQMGSGTWDLPVGLSWIKQQGGYRWGANLGGVARLGENDHNYRLGNRFEASAWLLTTRWQGLEPGVRLAWHWQGAISGADPDIAGADPLGRYPTPAVDPSKYGGKRLDAGVFLRLFFSQASGSYLDLESSFPVYQDLNGPQVGTSWRFGVRLGTEF